MDGVIKMIEAYVDPTLGKEVLKYKIMSKFMAHENSMHFEAPK